MANSSQPMTSFSACTGGSDSLTEMAAGLNACLTFVFILPVLSCDVKVCSHRTR